MRTSDHMTTEVAIVSPETEVEQAYRLMKRLGIRNMPVVDRQGALVGIVTNRDLRHVLIPFLMDKPLASRLDRGRPEQPSSTNTKDAYQPPEGLTVGEVMTREVITIRPDTEVAEAVALVYEHKFGALPVVDDEGAVVGILTQTDLIALLYEMIQSKHLK